MMSTSEPKWLRIRSRVKAALGDAANLDCAAREALESLQNLEEIHQVVVEHAAEGIVVFDPESGAILESNAAFQSFLGYTGAELAGLSLFDILERERGTILEEMRRLSADGHLEIKELRYRRKDGACVEAREICGRLTHGRHRLAVGIAQDLSARKQAEAERDRLAEILEATPDYVGISDTEGREIFRNHAMRELRGPVGAELGRPVWEAHPAWAARKVMEEGLPTAARAGIWRGETAFLDREGREVPASQVILSHRDKDGKLAYFSTIARDISEQKRAVRDLNDLVKRLQDLRHAVDESTVLAITDARGVILEVNDRFCQVSGYSRDELVGSTHRVINSHYHSRAFFKEMWTTIRAGRVWRGEVRNQAKDGSIFWADSTIVPWLDEAGKPVRFFVLRVLITERKLAEETLLRRKRQMELIAGASRELNQDLELPVIMRKLVQTGLSLTGATSGAYGQVENQTVRLKEFIRDGRWEAVDMVFAPLTGLPGLTVATHQPQLSLDAENDPRILRDSRHRLGLRSIAAIPILGRNAELLAYFSIHNKAGTPFDKDDQALLEGLAAHAAVALENTRLVGALRREQEALRRSEERYRNLVDGLHEGLVLMGPGGDVEFSNPRLAEMLGYGEGETVVLGPGFQRDACLTCGGTAGSTGVFEARIPRKNGRPLDVLISRKPVRDESGASRGSLLLITDNTEHRRAEELFRQAQKGESLALMAGGVAHDFNNLFQALQGNLELARGQVQDAGRTAGAIGRCLELLGKAAALSGKMLEYSGKGFMRLEDLDLGRLLRDQGDRLRESVWAGCDLSFALEEELPIAGDPRQLAAVLDALVRNAAEAMEGGPGAIEVGAARILLEAGERNEGYWPEPAQEEKCAVLWVRDTGPGIEPGLLGKVFDPFFTTKDPGRGLGLSSVLGIVRAHHAALQVKSAPGRGTQVRVLFPLQSRSIQLPVPQAGAKQASAEPGRKTILLVEDDEMLRATLQEILVSILGFDVRVARDGKEGIDVFQEDPDGIDLILMDASMPRMNGAEAFDRIKGLRPGAKAILCSGFSESLGGAEAERHGFLGFLKKPFAIRELEEILGKALSG